MQKIEFFEFGVDLVGGVGWERDGFAAWVQVQRILREKVDCAHFCDGLLGFFVSLRLLGGLGWMCAVRLMSG